MSKSITDVVKEMESNYVSGTSTISKYVNVSMYEDICTIDAYLNSKHISGDTDSLGREKPFFNIVTAASNIWFRATDIDRKNFKITTKKAKAVLSTWLATIRLHELIYTPEFALFLNNYGKTLARYGSVVTKHVEKDGTLISNVVPWNKLIVDPISFENNPVIELLELTEDQLRMNEAYDQEVVEQLCNAKTTRKTIDGRSKDTNSNYIKLYEVHGILPLSELTGKESDKKKYRQIMFVISYVASKEKRGEYDSFILASGEEEKSPYMISHLIEEDGQTLSYGAVRHMFNSQWMINHTMKSAKDQLDLASKLIFQTADDTFLGNNALNSIQTGDILIHKPNMPLTQVNNNSHDIGSLQSYATSWKVLSNEVTGISESMLGNTAPSGTAWRQVETILQENYSLFKVMRQTKGLFLEKMIRTYYLPYLKKQLNNSDEIKATLEEYDIKKIDSKYVKNFSTKTTNKIIKQKFLSGEVPTPKEQADILRAVNEMANEDMAELGNDRFFKPSEINWKKELDNLDGMDIKIDVTDENIDQDAFVTLNTLLKFIASKQGQPLTDDERVVFNKILMMSGTVSPLELQSMSKPATPVMPATPTPTIPSPMASTTESSQVGV